MEHVCVYVRAHLVFHFEMHGARGQHVYDGAERAARPRLQRAKDAAAPVTVPAVSLPVGQIDFRSAAVDLHSTALLLFAFELLVPAVAREYGLGYELASLGSRSGVRIELAIAATATGSSVARARFARVLCCTP